MEMEVKNTEFWVLENKSKKGDVWLYNDLQDAVMGLKELMASGAKAEDLSLISVDVHGEDWKIKQVPWSEIAERLVKIK